MTHGQDMAIFGQMILTSLSNNAPSIIDTNQYSSIRQYVCNHRLLHTFIDDERLDILPSFFRAFHVAFHIYSSCNGMSRRLSRQNSRPRV